MKKTLGLIAVAMLLATPVLAADVPTYNCDYEPSCEVAPGIYGAISNPVKSKFDLSIGGFVKLDYAYNSVNLGANGANLPGPPGGNLPPGGTVAARQDQSILTARQSRFWLKAAGPTFLGAKTGSVIEGDFYGSGGTNEAANLRMRHAYGTLDWANTQVLFGQSQDIFGPAIAGTQDTRSGTTTGTPNNPRVPQVRLTQKINFNADNSLKLVLGVQNPVEDQTTPNAFGSVVNGAGQLMFISKALGQAPGYYGLAMNNLTLGIFGLVGSQKVNGGTAATTNRAVDVYGYGVYGFVPVLKSKDGKNRALTASLEAQGYISSGVNWSGANANTPLTTTSAVVGIAPNQTGAKGYGVYGQLIFYPTQDLGITGGYERRNALNYASYGTTAFEQYNELIYGNVTYDLNAAVRVAAEYEHARTQYSKTPTGTGFTGANSDLGQANIIRFCAYYFF